MTTLKRVAILADASALSPRDVKRWREYDLHLVRGGESLLEAIEELLCRDAWPVIVDGDDRFLGRIVTSYLGNLHHRSRPLRLLPLADYGLSTVADAITGGLERREVLKRLARLDERRWENVSVSTLKITASSRASADYGFSFGAGWWYTAFEAYHRSGRADGTPLGKAMFKWGQDLVSHPPRAGGDGWRLSVDYRPQPEGWTHLQATTLAQSWLGLAGLSAPGGQSAPTLRIGEKGADLLREWVTPRALTKTFVAPVEGTSFERVHLDGASGYVIDGELYGAGAGQVLELARGPRIFFMRPDTSLLGRVVGLVRRNSRPD